MKISDQISMCLNNLLHRKMRTLLTVTGVMVGTCLVVIVISLGIAMNAQQEAMIQSMGDLTRITVYTGYNNDTGERKTLDDDAVAQIAAIPGVDVATPLYQPRNLEASLYAGRDDRYKWEGFGWNVTGIYAEAFPKMGFTLIEGEYPTHQTNPKKPIYVLAGQNAAYNFQDTTKKESNSLRYRYPQTNEDGEIIMEPFVSFSKDDIFLKTDKQDEDSPDSTVVTREIKVAGRVEEDYNKMWQTADGIIMELQDLKALEAAYMKANKIKADSRMNSGYNEVRAYAHTMEDVDAIDAAIKAMGYQTESLESVRKPMQDNIKQQQLFLGLLGGVSLLVAAIGITNTMFMSIYERTREIGVMKVLGCRVGNIRSVFLMEAGAIGFVGGIVGVVLSFAASAAINYFKFSFGGSDNQDQMYRYGFGMGGGGADPSSMPVSMIPMWLVGAAILFATLVGLLSGVMPANRAMKISALEAIKHE